MTEEQREKFILELTSFQNRLFGFILTLLPDSNQANDVLQDTNLIIWRKAEEFAPGSDSWAWASKIAHFRVLRFYRDCERSRHVFDEALLAELAIVAGKCDAAREDRLLALKSCLARLKPAQQQLIQSRYLQGNSVKAIAEQTGQSKGAVAMALFRVRKTLYACIGQTLNHHAQP
jgi:RNA polymerase sigma-70 factor, ECF subfamily